MPSAANTLMTARTMSGLSRRQVALLADVSPSTVSRIESGAMSPTVDMLDRLLDAAGYEMSQTLAPKSDPVAIAAARSVLDPDCGLGATPGVGEWLRRWETIGLVTADGKAKNRGELCYRAGRSSKLTRRPGVCSFARDRTWVELGGQLNAAGIRWATTGGIAANRLRPSGDAVWPIFYVESPESASKAIELAPPDGRSWPITLVPSAGYGDNGVEVDDDGMRWADPLQVVIDCYAGSDRMPEQADVLVEALAEGGLSR
jgi:transcriptional regulator with XRE-family HTH domain